jgi:mycothiol synthase
MSDGFRIEARQRLDPATVEPLIALIDRVTNHDGMQPLSEHVWLHLKGGGDERGQHLIAWNDDGAIIGYAHLDVTDAVEGASAELAVDPAARRQGLGRCLIEELIRHSPDGRLRLWAHGEQAGAAELASSMGFQRARVLWQMRRSLYAPLPRPMLPPGVELRPFRVGVDESAWLDLNARAFANLPDQGGLDREDLALRIREQWFSPEGFLMAWRGDRLVGFHWTKVHGQPNHPGDHAAGRHGDGSPHHHLPIGEVYVVGVDPDERGRGLGGALTLAGLHHLRSLDLSQAMLYVDTTNTTAIALYERLGFARWDSDVLFRKGA